MALLESKEKCLPVREIYEWIEEHFPFYKNVSNAGWKSSIRHNLSFSKCFKKMDRTEAILCRSSVVNNKSTNDFCSDNQRKRRAPNSTGTCWAVSPECNAYLVQTLKKSSFWFHNSKSYPSLNEYITNFALNGVNLGSSYIPDETSSQLINDHFIKCCNSTDLQKKNYNKKLKVSSSDLFKYRMNNSKITKLDNKHESEKEEQEEEEEDEQEKQINLIQFVQQQQEQLRRNNYSPNSSFDSNCSEIINGSFGLGKKTNNFDSNDLAAAAVLASTALSPSLKKPIESNKLDLSLSSSSSSLSSAFSLLSSSSPSHSNNFNEQTDPITLKQEELSTTCINSINLNSDLEMEVASTLVGMKFSKSVNFSS